jgi:hypothetical protein
MILGGSTNAVLHLIAIAHSVGIKLEIDDFQSVSDRIPFIADLKPSGKYVFEDVYKIGGIPSKSPDLVALRELTAGLYYRDSGLPPKAQAYRREQHDGHGQDARREFGGMDPRAWRAALQSGCYPASGQAYQGHGPHPVRVFFWLLSTGRLRVADQGVA